MEFKLGQKVRYKRISKKIEIDMQYWAPRDFEEYEEKILERRELIELGKERIGYIMGRRKLVFKTIFSVNNEHYDSDDDISYENVNFVDIARQEKGFAYLVAYGMGQTNYVLEEDLKEVN